MKLLSLNCQQGYQPLLKSFLPKVLNKGTYDFLLLQEVNEEVLLFLNHPDYRLVRLFNEEVGHDSDLCIVYRRINPPISAGFKSFASMHKDPVHGFRHPSFGLLWADFEIDNRTWRIASIHLHSGINRRARTTELQLAKIILQKASAGPVIIAGDFNAGWPGEGANLAQVLAPDYMWVSKNLGPTFDSRYTENVAHITDRIAALLSMFNIGIRLRTDHIFTDQATASRHQIQCSILPDRVSDHSPVEFTIS